MPEVKKPKPDEEQKNNDKDVICNSIIGIGDQSYGQSIPITGTSLDFFYNSNRTPGRLSEITINLSGSSIPSSLLKIFLEVHVGGRSFEYIFNPEVNLRYTFQWDKKDAYGRILYGSQPIKIRIGYQYLAKYFLTTELARSFMQNGQGNFTNVRSLPEIRWTDYETRISGEEKYSIAGWNAGNNHSYDPFTGILIYGNGSRRSNAAQSPLIKTLINTTFQPLFAVASDHKGNIYYSSGAQIHKLNNDGTIELIAGTGEPGFSGDEGPATSAQLDYVTSIDINKRGELILSDRNNNRIRKISSDGNISTIAGTGSEGTSGDGGKAVEADIIVNDLAISSDGSIYFTGANRVRKITPDAMINTIAGSDEYGFAGDGGPVSSAMFNGIEKIDVGKDGSVYIYEYYGYRLRKISPDGIVKTIAGMGFWDYPPFVNGSIANESPLSGVHDIEIGNNDEVYLSFLGFIACITRDGMIKKIAGGGNENSFVEDYPAGALQLMSLPGLTVLPDNSIVFLEEELGISKQTPGQGKTITPKDLNFSKLTKNSVDYKSVQVTDSKISSTQDEFPYGNRIRKIYDPLPLIKSSAEEINIVSEDGNEIYQFNGGGKHLKTINALNRKTIYDFNYNSSGLLTSVTDIDGLATTINWNNNKPYSITSPFNQTTFISTNSNGFIDKIINPANDTVKFEYTSSGLMTKMIDAKGNPTYSYYDESGKFIKEISADSAATELSFNNISNGYRINVTTGSGTKEYTYENLDDGITKNTTVGTDGFITETYTDIDGSTETYHPNGMFTKTVLGPDPRFGMQAPLVKLAQIKTPEGIESVSEMYRRISQMVGDKVTGLVDSIIVNDKLFMNLYDGIQNKIESISPMGRASITTLDTLGRIMQSFVPGIEPVDYKYNQQGFLIETSQGVRKSTFTYDPHGRVKTITDPMLRTESFAYDSVGRVTKQVLSDLREIHYTYDANGNLTSITPPGRPAHTFDYTPVDLTNSYTPPPVPDTTITQYEYNLDKQLTKIFRPDGSIINFSYGPNCGCTSAGKPETISFDRGTQFYTCSENSGQLETIATPANDTLSYTYDGSLITNVQWKGNVNGNVYFIYDNDFRVFRQIINNDYDIYYYYDDDGLLINAGDMNITRDEANGLVTGTTLGNVTGAFTYNSYGEMDSYTAKYNGNNIFSTTYAQDSLGRITEINETVNGISKKLNYKYNTYGYLTGVLRNDSTVSVYTYDANGNRKSAAIEGIVDTADYDDQDRMVLYGNSNYVYTKNGDLRYKITGSDTTKYFYDSFGNLINVILPNGTFIDYIIDGQNRRIAKKVNGNFVKRWIYKDQLSPVAELDSLGNIVSVFAPGYIVKNNSTYQIVTDHLGSVRLAVNVATGAIAQRMDYDEYGNVLLNTNPDFQPFGFAGGLYDDETKFVRFGARDYDAQVGRWTVKDPILFGGGVSNLYEYCVNDPINKIDLKGKQGVDKDKIIKQIKNLYDAYSEGKEQKEAMEYWGELINDPHKLGNSELYVLQTKLKKINYLIDIAGGFGVPEALKEFNDLIKEYEKQTSRSCPTLKEKEKPWWQIW